MRKILIVILILYTYLSFGQIPLMVNNKPNYDINCILEKKYISYKDTCIVNVNKYKRHWGRDFYLNVNDFEIKVFCYIYFNNLNLKIDSTTNLMNEMLVDTTTFPYYIQFYRYKRFWGIMDFGRYGYHWVDVFDEKDERDKGNRYLRQGYCKELIEFKPDYVFYLKGDYENGMVLQKGNNIYYYIPINGKIEPLYKHLIDMEEDEKLYHDVDRTY
ncbi:MAG: hypothetical protein WCL51_18545 [Bacteroidota bacterium]